MGAACCANNKIHPGTEKDLEAVLSVATQLGIRSKKNAAPSAMTSGGTSSTEALVRHQTMAIDKAAVDRLHTENKLDHRRALTQEERQEWWASHRPGWYVPQVRDVSLDDIQVAKHAITSLSERSSNAMQLIRVHFPEMTVMSFLFDQFWARLAVFHTRGSGLKGLTLGAKAAYMVSMLKALFKSFDQRDTTKKRLATREAIVSAWKSSGLDMPTVVHTLSAVYGAIAAVLDTMLTPHRASCISRLLSFVVDRVVEELPFTTIFKVYNPKKAERDIAWADQLLCGVPQIDTDHEFMVELVNGFGRQLFQTKTPDFFVLNTILDCITTTTIIHFAHEEALWPKYQYKEDIDTHRKEHDALLERLVELCKQWEGVYAEYKRQRRLTSQKGDQQTALNALISVTPVTSSSEPVPSSLLKPATPGHMRSPSEDPGITAQTLQVPQLFAYGSDDALSSSGFSRDEIKVESSSLQQAYDELKLPEVWKMLQEWIENHEAKQDAKFSSFLRSKNINVTWSGVQPTRRLSPRVKDAQPQRRRVVSTWRTATVQAKNTEDLGVHETDLPAAELGNTQTPLESPDQQMVCSGAWALTSRPHSDSRLACVRWITRSAMRPTSSRALLLLQF